jgi:hypothetical protein
MQEQSGTRRRSPSSVSGPAIRNKSAGNTVITHTGQGLAEAADEKGMTFGAVKANYVNRGLPFGGVDDLTDAGKRQGSQFSLHESRWKEV